MCCDAAIGDIVVAGWQARTKERAIAHTNACQLYLPACAPGKRMEYFRPTS